jgi:hypothetical protein
MPVATSTIPFIDFSSFGDGTSEVGPTMIYCGHALLGCRRAGGGADTPSSRPRRRRPRRSASSSISPVETSVSRTSSDTGCLRRESMRRLLGPRSCSTSRTRRRCWLRTRPRFVALLPSNLATSRTEAFLTTLSIFIRVISTEVTLASESSRSRRCASCLLRTSCTSSDTARRIYQGL